MRPRHAPPRLPQAAARPRREEACWLWPLEAVIPASARAGQPPPTLLIFISRDQIFLTICIVEFAAFFVFLYIFLFFSLS
jgi:hypothetical protein